MSEARFQCALCGYNFEKDNTDYDLSQMSRVRLLAVDGFISVIVCDACAKTSAKNDAAMTQRLQS